MKKRELVKIYYYVYFCLSLMSIIYKQRELIMLYIMYIFSQFTNPILLNGSTVKLHKLYF